MLFKSLLSFSLQVLLCLLLIPPSGLSHVCPTSLGHASLISCLRISDGVADRQQRISYVLISQCSLVIHYETQPAKGLLAETCSFVFFELLVSQRAVSAFITASVWQPSLHHHPGLLSPVAFLQNICLTLMSYQPFGDFYEPCCILEIVSLMLL